MAGENQMQVFEDTVIWQICIGSLSDPMTCIINSNSPRFNRKLKNICSPKEPEPSIHYLQNPARVVRLQLKALQMPENSRYRPLKALSQGGIIMLKDKKAGQEKVSFVIFLKRNRLFYNKFVTQESWANLVLTDIHKNANMLQWNAFFARNILKWIIRPEYWAFIWNVLFALVIWLQEEIVALVAAGGTRVEGKEGGEEAKPHTPFEIILSGYWRSRKNKYFFSSGFVSAPYNCHNYYTYYALMFAQSLLYLRQAGPRKKKEKCEKWREKDIHEANFQTALKLHIKSKLNTQVNSDLGESELIWLSFEIECLIFVWMKKYCVLHCKFDMDTEKDITTAYITINTSANNFHMYEIEVMINGKHLIFEIQIKSLVSKVFCFNWEEPPLAG